MTLAPFTIAISSAEISDLQARLERMRWPDEIDQSEWNLGTNKAFLQSLTNYWLNEFDWPAQQARLNAFAQFTLAVDGRTIHFIHARSPHANAQPLILSHGWPGSIVEFLRIIPKLTHPEQHGGRAEDAFHVVAPSLPGFGFSSKPTGFGTNTLTIAELFAQVMTALGYERFFAQGGDFGTGVTIALARLYPQRVMAIHLNMMQGRAVPSKADIARRPLSPAEEQMMKDRARFAEEGGAYAHVQRTKPQSLGFALNDSPVGLAAWIAEKFHAWTDNDGDPTCAVSRDDLLTNISIYWFTQTITSSMRLYYESQRAPALFKEGEKIIPPLGFAAFPREIVRPPREFVERFFDVRHWTEMPRGGHFAALEQPDLLAADIRKFFGTVSLP